MTILARMDMPEPAIFAMLQSACILRESPPSPEVDPFGTGTAGGNYYEINKKVLASGVLAC
jgi:hypothetical protein